MRNSLNIPIFRVISDIATQNNVPAYVVGGFVRDTLLNRVSDELDIDIVVVGGGIEMARKVAKSVNTDIKVTVFKNYGNAMFRYK